MITMGIVLFLINYRRVIVRALGKHSGRPHLNTMTILIESASLIVVVDVFALATILIEPVTRNVALQLWIQVQVRLARSSTLNDLG
jgi:hypothetical protein